MVVKISSDGKDRTAFVVNCTIASLKKDHWVSRVSFLKHLLPVTIGEILLACCSIQAMSPLLVPQH